MTPDHLRIPALIRENKDLRSALGKLMLEKQELLAALDRSDAAAAHALQRKFEGKEEIK
jgi:hypothetical protein